MNRRERRRYKPRDPQPPKRMLELQDRVEATGKPGRIYGLIDACRDCTAEAELILLPGRRTVSHVYHDEGCPAALGITTWAPCPID